MNGAVTAAVRLAWIADYETIVEAVRGTRRRSIEHAILQTAIAAEPDRAGALDALVRSLSTPSPAVALVADRVIALLLSQGALKRVRWVVETVRDVPEDLRAARFGHLAQLAAYSGSATEAFEAAAAADAANTSDDDLVCGLTKARLARAHFHLGRYDLASRQALSAALHFERVGAKRRAASILSIPMAVAHAIRADVETAREYGERALGLVSAQGFHARTADVRAALLLHAAELADGRRYAKLEPEVPTTPFPARLARVVAALGAGDATLARRLIAPTVVVDLTAAQRMLCEALLGLCAIALGDDDAAFSVCQGLHPLTTPAGRPDEGRYARIALALGVAVNARLGRCDGARGLLRSLEGTIEWPLAAYAVGNETSVPPAFRAYAVAIELARGATAGLAPVPLTPAELRLLPLLSAGKDVRDIARETDRSAKTIRTHLERLRAKLGVRRSDDLVERARDLGIA